MNLHEYQSKQIFSRYGIPIPSGRVAATAEEARLVAEELGGRVVVKAQVLIGGRGKAGGIRIAETPQAAEHEATEILRMEIRGLPVRKVLIDEAAEIESEIYLGVTNDRSNRSPVLIASAEGGVEIEEVARATPDKIFRARVDPLLGLREFQARNLSSSLELPRGVWRSFSSIASQLYQVYWDMDASLAEINPLVITKPGELLALDGKMVIDDNALFRHPELEEVRDPDSETPAERDARKYGLSYIQLDGTIGCMVNGAGLAMATMDVIKLFGGRPANFLDIGGGASSEKVSAALQIILADKKVEAVLLNIFGGITRGDEVARGIVEALDKVQTDVPIVARLVGTNEEEGQAILADSKMITAQSLADAAKKAVEVSSAGAQS